MLFRSEEVKQRVLLLTYSHKRPDFVGLFEHVFVIAESLARGTRNQASQNVDRRRFTSAVLAEEHKNLVLVHPQIKVFDSLNAIAEYFIKILDAKIFAINLLTGNLRGSFFEVLVRIFKFDKLFIFEKPLSASLIKIWLDP